MNNPFKFGEAVTGEYFTNRRKEIKDIKEYIKSAQNLFIYSQRRLGKTSLIKTVLKRFEADSSVITIYVDLQRASTPGQFIEVYAKSITKAFSTKQEKIEKITGFFQKLMPSFEYTEGGNFKVSFDFSRTASGMGKALEEVYEIPQRIAEKYNKRVAVVFDEFQEISKYNGIEFEKNLRSFVQHHSGVCYIFMGSKTHVIRDMFENADRAFYQAAKIYPIDTISKEDLIKFIQERFGSTGRKIDEILAGEIANLSQNSPFHVQMLCSQIWLEGGGIINKEDVDAAVESLMHTQNELYYSWYNNVSMHQRAVLGCLSRETEIFSNDVRLKNNLGSTSTVQSSVKTLVNKNYVVKRDKKYEIYDPFFRIWLRKNTL
ncbi:MAG: ATP-binding protein [Candidatus Krumholzibacteriota bacterium]|nr:ATP-binding protein [Candidatus Krumholzibacteriota bacterium]